MDEIRASRGILVVCIGCTVDVSRSPVGVPDSFLKERLLAASPLYPYFRSSPHHHGMTQFIETSEAPFARDIHINAVVPNIALILSAALCCREQCYRHRSSQPYPAEPCSFGYRELSNDRIDVWGD